MTNSPLSNAKARTEPMRSFHDLEDATYKCPCGESIKSDDTDAIKVFMAEHKVHTNGKLVMTITEDGYRILSRETPRVTEVDLP